MPTPPDPGPPPSDPGPPPGQPAHLPSAAVGRLSLYLRELQRLAAGRAASISSAQLGRLIEVSPEVIRKDLAAIGAVGRRGVGYRISQLCERIGAILGTEGHWEVVLVGVGSLGTALLRYRGLERQGFRIVAAYDIAPHLIGTEIAEITIEPFAALRRPTNCQHPDLANRRRLAILAVPADSAGSVAQELVALGIVGILNFAPISLKLPKQIGVVNVDLASEMQRLAFTVGQLPAATAKPDKKSPPRAQHPL